MRKGVERLDELMKGILPVTAPKPSVAGPGLEFCLCRMNGDMLRTSIQYLELDASNALNCDLQIAYIQKGCIDVAFALTVSSSSAYKRIRDGFHSGAFDALVAKHEVFRVNFINWPEEDGSFENDTLAFELQD